MKQNICERLAALKKIMKENGVAYYYITTADYHASEYADDYFKEREVETNWWEDLMKELFG